MRQNTTCTTHHSSSLRRVRVLLVETLNYILASDAPRKRMEPNTCNTEQQVVSNATQRPRARFTATHRAGSFTAGHERVSRAYPPALDAPRKSVVRHVALLRI